MSICEKAVPNRVFCGSGLDEIYLEIAALSIFCSVDGTQISFKNSLGAHFHAEAHISTESSPPLEDPRVSQPHED
jgi:hypothetical protein